MTDELKGDMTPEEFRDYLDAAIRNAREMRDDPSKRVALALSARDCVCYVDAYQSIRTSMFGETLPIEERETETASEELGTAVLELEVEEPREEEPAETEDLEREPEVGSQDDLVEVEAEAPAGALAGPGPRVRPRWDLKPRQPNPLAEPLS